ncbi:MAG: dimethylsulfonioproprionate lyase family protein [bacterium]|nr:dimethylsulfonioproprionate lyase family protein [bacterium]
MTARLYLDMAGATGWLLSDLAEEIERALAEGGAGDGRLVEGRATAVKASPEQGNSSKIVMGTSCLPPHFSTAAHSHQAEEVSVVLSGGGWMDVDETPHTLQPGGILLVPSNLPHRAHSGPDGLTVLWLLAPPGSEPRRLAEHDDRAEALM